MDEINDDTVLYIYQEVIQNEPSALYQIFDLYYHDNPPPYYFEDNIRMFGRVHLFLMVLPVALTPI